MDPSTSPPCDSDDEDAERAHEQYMLDQAGEVVRGEIGKGWQKWGRDAARSYLVAILTEDFGQDAAHVSDREADAFLRLCSTQQARLDEEQDEVDRLDPSGSIAFDPIAAEEA